MSWFTKSLEVLSKAQEADELEKTEPNTEDPMLKKAEFSLTVPIFKSDIEGKVYGIVLEPDLEDSQHDKASAAEIEKSAHDFMVASRKADRQHNEVQADADLIENWIAPQDLLLEGEPVTKGSWVQGWQVNDPVLKQEIAEGKITGLSMGGRAIREPVTA